MTPALCCVHDLGRNRINRAVLRRIGVDPQVGAAAGARVLTSEYPVRFIR
jgi:hypothetical protein